MTRQIKTTLLSGLFFFGLLTGLQAQDKYDFAVLTFSPMLNKDNLQISYDNKSPIIIEVSKSEIKNDRDFTPALKQISKMQEDGWELFNTDISNIKAGVDDTFVFYLRKKRQ